MKPRKFTNYLLAAILPFLNLNHGYASPLENKVDEISRKIRETPLSQMRGADGSFHVSSEQAEIGQELPQDYKEYVIQHELAHASGIDGSARGEYLADVLAAERTGKARYIRGPFYQPPLR